MSSLPYPQPGSPDTTAGEFNNTTPNTNTGSTNVLGTPPATLQTVPVGSTSNVTGYLPDILTIIEEACEQSGYDFTSPYSLRSAKRSLDFLSMAWANYGLNLWTIDLVSTPLTYNNPGPYAMPPDTIDMLYPAIRTTNPNQNDILVTLCDFKEYMAIPNKLTVGQVVEVYVQRISPAPQFYVWETPNNNTNYTLIWYRLRRMQNTGYATNLMDVPFRFVPAMTFGLAWQMALKKEKKDLNLINTLKANYDEAFARARYEDRERSPVRIAPWGYGRGCGSRS